MTAVASWPPPAYIDTDSRLTLDERVVQEMLSSGCTDWFTDPEVALHVIAWKTRRSDVEALELVDRLLTLAAIVKDSEDAGATAYAAAVEDYQRELHLSVTDELDRALRSVPSRFDKPFVRPADELAARREAHS